MKPGIKIVECNYYTNRENGTITCVLQCNMYLYGTALGDLIRGYSPGSINYKADLPNGVFIVRGIARCSPDDTFNETVGKRIAESKAKAKAFLKGEAIMHEWIRQLEKITSYVQDRANSCYRAFAHEQKHLTDLGGNSIKFHS